VEVLRGFVAEFTAVMREHEEYLLSELAPSDDQVVRARSRRAAAWEGYDDEDE
jgi:hypothetical protein